MRIFSKRRGKGIDDDAAWMRLIPILCLLTLAGLWQMAVTMRLFPVQVLVPPSVVAQTFASLWASGDLQRHLSFSLSRLFLGFGFGSAAGLALGAAMGLWQPVRRIFQPTFDAVRYVPVITFIPLLILFFDVEELFKVVVVSLATFFPVAIATFDGVRAIPRGYFEVSALYRLPLHDLILRVVFPATVPPVLTGMRLGLTRAWLSLVAAELLAADSGLGQMMEMGRQMFRIDVVMVGVILAGTIGFLLDRGMQFAEARLLGWRHA